MGLGWFEVDLGVFGVSGLLRVGCRLACPKYGGAGVQVQGLRAAGFGDPSSGGARVQHPGACHPVSNARHTSPSAKMEKEGQRERERERERERYACVGLCEAQPWRHTLLCFQKR